MSDLVATIRKNSREEIRILLDEFNGAPTFNARVFWTDAHGEARARHKGLAFRIDLLPEFAAAVQAALLKAQEQGLLK